MFTISESVVVPRRHRPGRAHKRSDRCQSIAASAVNTKNNSGENTVDLALGRRIALATGVIGTILTPGAARAGKRLGGGPTGGIPLENFVPIPGTSPPILYYDIKGASGATGGVPKGARVAVHYDLKFRNITVGTSRQGAGVTGGTPIGFTVGAPAGTSGGPFIKAFNEGIKGMGVGTVRRLLVPPEYAYGPNEVLEIPANASVTLDIELLSVAKDPITRGVKGAVAE
ncbi:Peptidyl-prolyl cis-trans isomerase,FKBP-type,domain [Ostreococcus tauri]|uniref:peptidylprolyl isomerase n=1 Tax=Ostreococcus tauri TaxID=70448 RepID=A0A096P8P3_OSTTA|nr:Peptidyl-prolyl cis-trans isomerase,FKBP-type,domain [Ostreococcus tauri]CEG00613.1 Peptidyl-prolyl cis-trans isomerase,FKBP-type,domain [Ostreococcus tauri]|eukprot:XP_022840476.1 Peptidyl-prolyl cis-trans isomerase,FKBP-type,domain [Ostreococcus tauri]